MSDMLHEALSVSCDLGLPVFPCRETLTDKGKIAKSPYTRNGYKDATTDETQIRQWWGQYSNALIGVPTGMVSGIFVIDIDQSDGKNGEASYSALDIGNPITCQTITVSGGRHLIFKYPEGHDLKNTASGPLGKHIDTRGNGGYVIWAGSKTELGDYAYREGFSYEEMGFRPLLPELLELLCEQSNGHNQQLFGNQSIAEGKRNDTLFREGVTLANHGVSDGLVAAHIEARAAQCEGSLDGSELRNIKQSALKYKGNATIPCTDLGNGERLVRDWAGEIIYCSDQKCWYAWSDTHWVMDEPKVFQYAKVTTRNIPAEGTHSPESFEKLIKWGKTSESIARQKAMVEAASTTSEITRSFDVFTKDEGLFNLQNGTFDLHEQVLREHRQTDYITKLANASLSDSASCQRWLSFIDEITDGDDGLARFLQKLCGYMLSGRRGEQIIVFLLGEGANGKSVFLSVLKHVFGTYAGVINTKALVERNANSIPSDIAALANKRFVMMSEFPEHAPLNTATVKSITGGDEITARHLYKEWFSFKPQFQIVCALNDLPRLTWVEAAYFRRVRIVPFERIFLPHERDKALENKLKSEADGIMNWMIEGYQLYKSEGLEPTAAMEALLAEYQTQEDPVGEFLDQQVIKGIDDEFIAVQEMLNAVIDYCHRQGTTPPEERRIRKKLRQELGVTTQRRRGHHGEPTRGWSGLRIIIDREDENPF